MIQVVDGQLELNDLDWKTEIGSNINPVDSLAFIASNLPDGRLKVTNAGDKEYAGGLVANKRPVPKVPGHPLPWAELSMWLTVPSSAIYNLARLETDLKLATPAAPNPQTQIVNIYEGSTQWNAETGTFQINTQGSNWTDIGMGMKDIEPDVEHFFAVRYYFDHSQLTYSVHFIQWDQQRFTVPENLRHNPCQKSNWEEVAAVQLQNEIYQQGSCEIMYRGITLRWSDASPPSYRIVSHGANDGPPLPAGPSDE